MINPAFQSIPAIQNIAKAPFRLQLCAFSTAMGDSSSVLRPNCWVMATPRSERDGREEIRHWAAGSEVLHAAHRKPT